MIPIKNKMIINTIINMILQTEMSEITYSAVTTERGTPLIPNLFPFMVSAQHLYLLNGRRRYHLAAKDNSLYQLVTWSNNSHQGHNYYYNYYHPENQMAMDETRKQKCIELRAPLVLIKSPITQRSNGHGWNSKRKCIKWRAYTGIKWHWPRH